MKTILMLMMLVSVGCATTQEREASETLQVGKNDRNLSAEPRPMPAAVRSKTFGI